MLLLFLGTQLEGEKTGVSLSCLSSPVTKFNSVSNLTDYYLPGERTFLAQEKIGLKRSSKAYTIKGLGTIN